MSAPLEKSFLIVQKYGGATVADPQRIKQVAARIAQLAKQKVQLVVVVSAMGKTTNQLIELAGAVSSRPARREMDMLLSTGERISMSLLSMALNDLGVPAISFTGSQAGILTSDSHEDAQIEDVKAFRVDEALRKNQVVILAGFQGVSPKTKEVTTIGRGGSDLTAVAMSAYLGADHCEILKDVPAVFSADPNIVEEAQPIQRLSYDQLLEMTFWGAKVLHYRSVELAKRRQVKLYIGPARSDDSIGTIVDNQNKNLEEKMFESNRILSINSHSDVLEIFFKSTALDQAVGELKSFLDKNQISFPQILFSEAKGEKSSSLFVTGPKEVLSAIRSVYGTHADQELISHSSVSLTCTGAISADLHLKVYSKLDGIRMNAQKIFCSGMTMTLFLGPEHTTKVIRNLHDLIESR